MVRSRFGFRGHGYGFVEDAAEFELVDKELRVWSDYPLEKQALEVYTRDIYLRFRSELRKVTSYNANHVGGQLFVVTEQLVDVALILLDCPMKQRPPPS